MVKNHYEFWPKRISKSLTIPETSIVDNLEVSAKRYPNKAAVYFYGNVLTYKDLLEEVKKKASFLEKEFNVSRGDRVLLYMQNCPQFIISYYAILSINAIVVPINPMNKTEELAYFITDSQASVAFLDESLFDQIQPLINTTSLTQVILSNYSSYAGEDFPEIKNSKVSSKIDYLNVHYWKNANTVSNNVGAYSGGGTEALIIYTSGTTGDPKGCIHSHKNVQANISGTTIWGSYSPQTVALTTLPLFHVTGMQHSMNSTIQAGGTIVLMMRWDRDMAGSLIHELGCTHWVNISTMMIDFLSNPNLPQYDISSLQVVGGGGAPLPKAIGEKLYELTGILYAEGYGSTETMSQTHFNPLDRPKLQCLGIPFFDVDARVIDSDTRKPLGAGEKGEIIVNSPQLFNGYWRKDEATKSSFIEMDGKTFFLTGDIGYFDEEGYFFLVDRKKRMINASGFKVWPVEVETMMYKHPAIHSVCVIAAPDLRRGETVKALIVLNDGYSNVTEDEIIEWCKDRMSNYKYPRKIEFVSELPISASGKVLWRKLQEKEFSVRGRGI
ncbi:long-chain-fatty-acid--CoA ligase [Alkalihalobacterium elongatum]|uniref:long-chain-fatty-acid--CoA ligase n=1 Tax=Alkalihalobacterium elongatum TaxID=2675466 RepID=UPI001C1F45DD|nr:long-chain-fatty-acid--CoA ligase [Alkalihalobacterium elongatum]